MDLMIVLYQPEICFIKVYFINSNTVTTFTFSFMQHIHNMYHSLLYIYPIFTVLNIICKACCAFHSNDSPHPKIQGLAFKLSDPGCKNPDWPLGVSKVVELFLLCYLVDIWIFTTWIFSLLQTHRHSHNQRVRVSSMK